MLTKTGSFKFHVESYVCDFTEKATLSVICNFILEAASTHAQQRGFGYEQILEGNVAWVLSRLSVEMYEYPGHNRDLTVETWIESVNHFFTERCFRFIDEKGTTVGYARTIWAAIDITTRRPIDLLTWRSDMLDYVEAEKECAVERMHKILPVENIEPCMGYSVRYSNIDINKHMSSIKYIEHIIDVFDLDMFKEKFIHKFDIVYLAEGRFGDKLKLYRQSISENEYIIDTKKDNNSICRSRIVWK